MTDFKVGDTVEIIGNVHKGRMGKITERRDAAGTLWPWKVTHLSRNVDSNYGIYSSDELKLVKPEPKFKVGDWVKVHGRHDMWDGTVGTVQKAEPWLSTPDFLYLIHKDDKDGGVNALSFFERQLEATEAPKLSFKVGTFVTFAEPDNDHWQGGKAEVIEGKGWGRYTTRLRIITGPPKNDLYRDNKGYELNFDPAHLKLWEAPKFAKGGILPKQEFGIPFYNYADFDAKLTSKLFAQFEDKPAPLKIYLAGPMTGIEHYNFPAFFTAARKLRAAGHTVFNPAENDMDGGFNALGMEGHEAADHGFSLREALKTDLSWICENADALVLLEGWESSKGVRAEMALAEALGLPKYEMAKLPAEVAK